MAAIDYDHWLQVWLGQPGESNRHACLFWFRIAISDHSFPDLDLLAADTAAYFYSGFGEVWWKLTQHAYVRVILFDAPRFDLLGTASFPGTGMDAEDLLPFGTGLTIFRSYFKQPLHRPNRLTFAPCPKTFLTRGRPNALYRGLVQTANAALLPGFSSQGRTFRMVVPSYKDVQWYDVERLEAGPLGCRHRRQQPRSNRIFGHGWKPLPF